MGMVFQNYAVWPHKTVFQNVVFGLRLRRLAPAEARRKVEHMLALVNLAGLGERYPAELSGGQQQRVALARSLVVEPGILLLDEPLSNLDAKLRERMRGELKELQRRTGITFVYVTHDQAEALALSDQVAVMSGGRLQQYGPPFEVYAHPASRMVADFMGQVNLLPGRVREMRSGIVTIELARDLAVAIAGGAGLAVGERVDVAIRPENIRLMPRPDAAAPAIATVTSHVFLGNLSEYQVALRSGPVLRVQTHPCSGLRLATPWRSRSTAPSAALLPRSALKQLRCDLARTRG
jgi:ABC-type Fe3+/spermidine/putrescine transport system ATPase subunit